MNNIILASEPSELIKDCFDVYIIDKTSSRYWKIYTGNKEETEHFKTNFIKGIEYLKGEE